MHHANKALFPPLVFNFDADVKKARKYIASVPIGAKLIRDFDKTGAKIVPTKVPSGGFQGTTNTITWNPHGVIFRVDGGRESSALILAHEMKHAVDFREWKKFKTGPFAEEIDENDEPRSMGVIMAVLFGIGIRPSEASATKLERDLARQLGEPIRRDYHDGEIRAGYVEDVTSHD